MAVTQNLYTGNGSTVLYSFTFPYLETTDIKVSVNGTNTTAYTLANATTIQFNTAPVNGAAIRIYRQTDDTALPATFYSGSAIRANDLNENFTQNLYVTQESTNNAATATSTANTALTNSNTAISTANSAVSTANTASTNASAAVATANTASSNASAAVSTANTASSNATTAVNTANAATATANSAASDAATALSTANAATSTANAASTAATNAVNTANAASSAASSAVSTANTASTNASNAVTTANTASTNATTAVNTANTAVTTANAAAAAVANAVLYTTVANVAAIPGSPTNNTAIEVTNSTGIESFTPLSGLPVGFVGSSGLSVRIIYQTVGSTWTWIQYFPNDPESRYLKLSGGTLTGQLRADDSTSVASPVIAFDGDTNTGVAHTGADELALVTGGSARLTIDGSGNVAVPGTLGVTGAITGSSTVTGTALIPTSSTVPTNGVYLPAANSVAISTGGSGRLFVDASGRVLSGADTAYSAMEAATMPDSALQIAGSDASYRALRYGADTNGPSFFFAKSYSSTVGSHVATPANANLGSIFFNGSNGTQFARGAQITAHTEDTVSGTSCPTFLAFRTCPSGGGITERLRITAAGLVGIGTSSVSYKLDINNTSGGNGGFRLLSTDQSTTRIRLENTGVGGRSYEIVGGLTGVDNSTFTVYDATAAATRLAIDSSGRVGIGATPDSVLHVDKPGVARLRIGYLDTSLNYYDADTHVFRAGNTTERGRWDSSGRLLVGTSSARTNFNAGVRTSALQVEGTSADTSFLSITRNSNNTAPCGIILSKTRGSSVGLNTIVVDGDDFGEIDFEAADGTNMVRGAQIKAQVDGTPGANDMPGRLVFSTTADGASSPTERMRITSSGVLKVSTDGTYNNAAEIIHEFRQTNNLRNMIVGATHASYNEVGITVNVHRSSTNLYRFFQGISGNFSDTEFDLLGDGNGKCDGAWTGGGADYAEYFEWLDSNLDAEDRRGISVVLDGDKIREAQAGEDPIGVISGNPSVVGDAAWNKWNGKYLRDEFGTYIQEDYEVTDDDGNTVIQQRRKLNPAYDPDVEYISREQRPEWDCVGLMGKLRIRKGQVTGSRWIKMRDISGSVEEWLVR